MRRELLERRTEMFRLQLIGAPLRDVVKTVSEKFQVDADSLYRDWSRREQWIPQIVQLTDPTLLHSFLEGARSVLPKAWLLAQDSKNPFVRLGALKLIKDTNLQVLDVLQSVGVIEKKPGQLNLLSLNLGFEADPDLKKVLMEEAERQRKERGQQPPVAAA